MRTKPFTVIGVGVGWIHFCHLKLTLSCALMAGPPYFTPLCHWLIIDYHISCLVMLWRQAGDITSWTVDDVSRCLCMWICAQGEDRWPILSILCVFGGGGASKSLMSGRAYFEKNKKMKIGKDPIYFILTEPQQFLIHSHSRDVIVHRMCRI